MGWKECTSTIGSLFGPVASLGKLSSQLLNDCADNGLTHCTLGITFIIGASIFVLFQFAKLYYSIRGGGKGTLDTTTIELLTGKSKEDLLKEFEKKYDIDNLMTEQKLDPKDPKAKEAFTKSLAANDVQKQSKEALEKSSLSPESKQNTLEQINKEFEINQEAAKEDTKSEDFEKISEAAKEVVE
jgi:hypothetical protein